MTKLFRENTLCINLRTVLLQVTRACVEEDSVSFFCALTFPLESLWVT